MAIIITCGRYSCIQFTPDDGRPRIISDDRKYENPDPTLRGEDCNNRFYCMFVHHPSNKAIDAYIGFNMTWINLITLVRSSNPEGWHALGLNDNFYSYIWSE